MELLPNWDLISCCLSITSRQIVFGKAFDLYNDEEVPVSQSLQERLAADELLMHNLDVDNGIAGLVLITESPMIVTSRSILTSEGEGHVRGALLIVREIAYAFSIP